MHEALHDEFVNRILKPFGLSGIEGFNSAWERTKEEYPWETAIIDQTIEERYGPLSSGSLANERFAWFGATFGKVGLKKLPRRLIPFYGGVFK